MSCSGESREPEALADEDVVDDGDEVSGILVDFEPDPQQTVAPTLVSRTDPPRSGSQSVPPSSRRPDLAAGAIVGGRFRLEQRVGTGGMGEVWAAHDTALGAKVAVKVLLKRAMRDSEIVARFEREALLLGRIHGDHAPRLVEHLFDPVYGPVLVTEFVEGPSLLDVIKTPLSVEQAVELGIDLATGLVDLHHASVIHRDLKPGNVIMRPGSDGKSRAILIDFGVSRLVHEPDEDIELADISTSDAVVGTIEYMAPEQILRCAQVTPSADLYALGTLLYRAVGAKQVFGPGLDKMELVRSKLTAKAPPVPTDRRDPVAKGFAKVVACALERNPDLRYQSAEELRADLQALRQLAAERATRPDAAEIASATVVPVEAPKRPTRATRRVVRGGVLAAIVAASLFSGVVVGGTIGRAFASRPPLPPDPIPLAVAPAAPVTLESPPDNVCTTSPVEPEGVAEAPTAE